MALQLAVLLGLVIGATMLAQKIPDMLDLRLQRSNEQVVHRAFMMGAVVNVVLVAFDTWRSGGNLVRAMIRGRKNIPEDPHVNETPALASEDTGEARGDPCGPHPHASALCLVFMGEVIEDVRVDGQIDNPHMVLEAVAGVALVAGLIFLMIELRGLQAPM